MAQTSTKRTPWTKQAVAELRSKARKMPVAKLAKAMRRTPGAIRQKAHSLGISMETRGTKKATKSAARRKITGR